METLNKFKQEWQPIINYNTREGEDNTMFFPKSIEELDFVKSHIGSGKIWSAVRTERKGLLLVNHYERGAKFYLICEKEYTIGEGISYVLEEGLPNLSKEDINRLRLIEGQMFKRDGVSPYTESLDKTIKYLNILAKNGEL